MRGRGGQSGARCSASDWRVNQIGRDPATGFAYRTDDNVGLQYGLGALNSGAIEVDELLDLNAEIGGYDRDGNLQADRMQGTTVGLRRTYAAGFVNSGGGGLAVTPILSFRSYNDASGDIHVRFRDIAISERLRKANGDRDNAVSWVAGPDRKKFDTVQAQALDTMTQWLDALDTAPGPLMRAKVIRYKPAGAVDAWFDTQGVKHTGPLTLTLTGASEANKAYPFYSDPRVVAGGPLANDVLKCQLKQPNPRDYKVAFAPAQWARLKQVFAEGVCEFTKPGVGQVPLRGTFVRY